MNCHCSDHFQADKGIHCQERSLVEPAPTYRKRNWLWTTVRIICFSFKRGWFFMDIHMGTWIINNINIIIEKNLKFFFWGGGGEVGVFFHGDGVTQPGFLCAKHLFLLLVRTASWLICVVVFVYMWVCPFWKICQSWPSASCTVWCVIVKLHICRMKNPRK